MAESNVAAAPKETQQSAKPTRKGSLLSRVAYSFGNVGQSAFYNALSTYFIVYVTSSLFSGVDKALATKLIGVITGLVVVIRIAEIFIDPLLGNIIDNTKTKWGRFKPWQLIGGTVSAVLLVLVYTGLFGLVNVNTTLFIVLFVITFIVLDVFYSLRDISYWGMIPALSSDSHERSTYTALGSFGGSIGYNGLTIVVIPIVTYFSYIFTGKHQESQSGWTCFAIIVAILGVLTVCSVAFGTKESSSTLRTKAEDNGGPLAAFKALAQNDQLLWVALSYLLYAIANVATTGVLMYMFKFILNNSAAYSIVGVVSVIAGIIMAPLYPILNKRIPRRYLYLGGMVLMVLGYLLYAIANVATTGVLLFLFKFVLDNQAAYSMTGVIALVAGLIMAPLYPILNKRIPRRVLYIVGMTSMIVAYILLGLFSTNMTVVFIALVLFYIPGTLIQMTAILSLTDSIEYGQLKNGKRNEAVTLSVRPMLDKIGGALSNGITGFIAVAAGMTGNATAADMTPSNIHTFEICAFYVPLILIVLSLLVFMFKVKIDEKMHAKIVKELEAKLASGEIVDDEAQTAETVEAIDEEAKTLTE